ncbi:1-acyl-sn-glycerol-3-phosphate acyltransferase [bacterium]|nr:1-acyl-sn-glycerol-3-phosphate acyltransferase [bacterium]
MRAALKILFFLLIVRPLVLIVIGLNISGRDKLPKKGPALVVANHNSHLDALVLLSLFPLRMLKIVRPVAAADYFFKNKWLKFFSQNVIDIIPIDRKLGSVKQDPLEPIEQALSAGQIAILFPEGTRGEPEQLQEFKTGIAHLGARHPDVPIIPIFMHGLGKSLPRGEAILVPFFCDVFIGAALSGGTDKKQLMQDLNAAFSALVKIGHFPE